MTQSGPPERNDDLHPELPLVLVVDDDVGCRKLVEATLKNDFVTIGAASGLEAMSLIERHRPDLVLLDLTMPGLGGIELTKLLRGSVPKPVIVLLTGSHDESDHRRAMEAGVLDVITKPFHPASLRMRAKNILHLARSRSDLLVVNQRLREEVQRLNDVTGGMHSNADSQLLKNITAGILHEVNHPLNYAKSALDLLRPFFRGVPEADREDVRSSLADTEDGLDRIGRIVKSLSCFAHSHVNASEVVSLGEIAETAFSLSGPFPSDVIIHRDFRNDVFVRADPGQLGIALTELFKNALYFSRAARLRGDEPSVTFSLSEAIGDYCELVVRDNGRGIVANQLGRVFDPFFTTKPVGEGIGLGLTRAMSIVRAHKGQIRVNSEPNRYSTFTVRLPKCTAVALQ